MCLQSSRVLLLQGCSTSNWSKFIDKISRRLYFGKTPGSPMKPETLSTAPFKLAAQHVSNFKLLDASRSPSLPSFLTAASKHLPQVVEGDLLVDIPSLVPSLKTLGRP